MAIQLINLSRVSITYHEPEVNNGQRHDQQTLPEIHSHSLAFQSGKSRYRITKQWRQKKSEINWEKYEKLFLLTNASHAIFISTKNCMVRVGRKINLRFFITPEVVLRKTLRLINLIRGNWKIYFVIAREIDGNWRALDECQCHLMNHAIWLMICQALFLFTIFSH